MLAPLQTVDQAQLLLPGGNRPYDHQYRIALIPGDGVGREVIPAGLPC